MTGRLILASSFCLVWLGVSPIMAQSPATQQDSASAQPTLPKPMPNLDVPVYGGATSAPRHAHAQHASHHRHHAHRQVRSETIDRPALANVELLEPLPHPPEPPHIVVPTPAYAFESITTAFTTPPPPIICQPTRHDRYKPDLGLIDERPVLCTADNP